MISIIAAISSNNAIGKDNGLLWHIPDDLERFKRITLGRCMIIGKGTWYSIGKKSPNEGRNIIMTHQAGLCEDGSCLQASSVEEALEKCGEGQEIFIAGGETVYRQFIDIVDRMYLTHVHKEYDEADTFFPDFDPDEWEIIYKDENISSPDLDLEWSYITYQRKKK